MENTIRTLTPNDIVRISLRYGLYACAAYIVYFLLMRVVGLASVIELRFLNYAFLAAAAFFAMRRAEEVKQWRLKYLQALIIGFVTGAASFAVFGVFIFIYSLFDSFIIDMFFKMFPGALAFGRFSAPVLIASEGISFSAIIGLGVAFFFQMVSEKRRKSEWSHQVHQPLY
jgi:hypothetical protein